MSDISNLVTKTALDTKAPQTENKITDITILFNEIDLSKKATEN